VAPQKLLIALHKWDLNPAEPWQRLAERGVLVVPGQDAAEPVGATEIPVLRTSAVAEPGTQALRRLVAGRLAEGAALPAEVAVVGQRQRDLLERAHAAVASARGLLQRAEGGELVAFELRAAHESLAELLGRRADPMLLEAIFSRFCVGK
jgi:tRNA modification GTPase